MNDDLHCSTCGTAPPPDLFTALNGTLAQQGTDWTWRALNDQRGGRMHTALRCRNCVESEQHNLHVAQSRLTLTLT